MANFLRVGGRRRCGKIADVRLSVFWTLMNDEFEAGYATSLARDHTVLTLGGRTVDEALEAGIPAREVWDAICDEMDVPAERRFGKEPERLRRRP